MKALRDTLGFLWSHWIAIAGTILTTASGNVLLVVLVVDLIRGIRSPYLTSVVYLGAPFLFLLGLLLVAAGAWRARVRIARGGAAPDARLSRRRGKIVAAVTVFNVLLVSAVAYKGITYSSSTDFCSRACHSAMAVEAHAYPLSAHSNVPCVDCHVGAGAGGFVHAKLSGLRRVWGVLAGSFSRPIPTPIREMPPAAETCQRCHRARVDHGARLLVRHRFASDEQNKRTTNVVRLDIGGYSERTGRYSGIHWHVDPALTITYEALDEKRTKIGKVTVRRAGEAERVYLPPKKLARAKVVERRTMDCLDCHNRAAHRLDKSPQAAVDRALAARKIDPTLPFIRERALALLKDTSVDPRAAAGKYRSALRRFYERKYAALAKKRARAIDKAARELGWIYRRNIFPAQRVVWGTYSSFRDHCDDGTCGCFRCHDDEHKTTKGEAISQDCEHCHEVLADDEEKPDLPAELLKLGRY